MKIKEFYCQSFDIRTMNLFWEIDELNDDILIYQIFILRSEFKDGPFIQIAGPFSNIFSFQDTLNFDTDKKFSTFFYKLKIINTRDNKQIETDPITNLAKTDLIGSEIIRQENMLFRKFIGRRCLIFQIKKYGYCVCVDRQTGRKLNSKCLTCYGTGFLGGYSNPIEQWIQIDPNAKTIQPTQNINHKVKVTSARLINYPLVQPQDVIVEDENNRWIVIEVRPSERLRSAIHQELVIKQLLDSDITYKLPINRDLKNKDVIDERLLTNPQTY